MRRQPTAGSTKPGRYIIPTSHHRPRPSKILKPKKLKGPNVIDTGGAFDYEMGKAKGKFPLTLYTADNCKENCRQARELLNRRGVPYQEKEIRTQADADEFRKVTGSQELFVPVLQAGSKTSKGFEEEAWNRLLDEAGYPARGNAKNQASPVSSVPSASSGGSTSPGQH